MDLTRTLPDELWSDTFGFLVLQDLYIVSQVCSYWRCIAFDHPSFWGIVDICSLSPGELGWASKRIAAGRTRPLHFTVSISGHCADIEAIVLPLIRDNLYRATRLEINIPAVYFERLCELLLSPAPALELLRLDMSSSPDHPIETFLPSNVLAGQVSALREVHLECVPLPPTPIPSFLRVETVILSWHDAAWHHFPPTLFTFFPEMRRLSLFGGSLLIPENVSPDMHAGFAQLDVMDVAYCPAENVKVLRHFPATAAIRHILLSHSDRDTVRAAVAQLPQRLMMIFLQPAHFKDIEIRIMYASCDARLIRTFVDLRDDFLPGELNAANAMLSDAAFVKRIAILRISTSLWSLACPFFPPDENHVEHLIVLVDDDGSHGDAQLPTQSFLCPRLKTLIIQAMGDFVRTSVASLVELSRLVAQTRLALELHRVVLQDDAGELERHFTTIIRTDQHNQGTLCDPGNEAIGPSS